MQSPWIVGPGPLMTPATTAIPRQQRPPSAEQARCYVASPMAVIWIVGCSSSGGSASSSAPDSIRKRGGRLSAFNQYNHTPHEGLGMDTPAERFHADSRQLRAVENRMAFDEAFVESFLRRVSNHNCIRFKGALWEIPLGYRGQKIQVFRNMLSDEISVLHDSKRIPLKKADFEANAYENRRTPSQSRQQTKPRRARPERTLRSHRAPIHPRNLCNKDVASPRP